MVVVGASAGGLYALRTLVAGLPADFELPVVVVQHRAKESELLCELLQECSRLPVQRGDRQDGDGPGRVCVGPPDYHLLVDDGFFSLTTDEPVRYSRPSIDVMFDSAADAYGMDVVGVVLTGANADGARGLRRIADAGRPRRGAGPRDGRGAGDAALRRSRRSPKPACCRWRRSPAHLASIRGRRVPRCRRRWPHERPARGGRAAPSGRAS